MEGGETVLYATKTQQFKNAHFFESSVHFFCSILHVILISCIILNPQTQYEWVSAEVRDGTRDGVLKAANKICVHVVRALPTFWQYKLKKRALSAIFYMVEIRETALSATFSMILIRKQLHQLIFQDSNPENSNTSNQIS